MTLLVDTSVLLAGTIDVDPAEPWAVSAISVGEMSAGVMLADSPGKRAARLRRLIDVLASAPVLPVDAAVAARYGDLRAASGRRPSNDQWIAATALAHKLTLVTRDRAQAALPGVQTRLVDTA